MNNFQSPPFDFTTNIGYNTHMAENTTKPDETPRKPIRCNEGTAREARLRDCIRLLTPMKVRKVST